MRRSLWPSRPVLCLVTDRSLCERLPAAVEAAVAGGVDWVQVREKDLDGGELLRLVEAVAAAAARGAAARGSGASCVLVNRRIDVALAAEAGGVHLGFDAVGPAEARHLLGDGGRVGVSCHDPDEVEGAARAGADYTHLAPIFAPRSKPATRPDLGAGALGRAAAHGIPVLAQGGVDAGNAGELVAAGAAGVAVTGSILLADEPGTAAAALRRALDAPA